MPIISQNRGPSHDKTVLLTVDTAFFPYALFLADQIATKNPARDFDICVVSSAPLPEHPLIDSLDLRVCVISIAFDQSDLPRNKRLSFAMYLRIFAAEALKQDYRRILYLDADIFYARGDISTLLGLDIGNHAIAAVRDTKQMRLPNRTPRDYKPFNLPTSKYFNSGFLLIDTEQFAKQELEKRVTDFALKNHEKLMHHDQTALNCVLHGDWAELSIVWNFQYNHQYALYAGMFDVCFFHFIGHRKPFNRHYNAAPRRFTEPYRVFFEAHFPEKLEGMSDGLEASTHKAFLGFMFLIHLLNHRKVLKNESRWRTDWDIK